MKVALYGGSFDPPHAGHVLAAAYLTCIAGFERVLVVPVYGHAFDKHPAPFEHRIRLCQLAFAGLGAVEVSAIESELEAPSYTISTVRALLSRHQDWQLRVVVGADVLPEIERWHESDELQRLAPLFVLGRSGWRDGRAPIPLLPEVSSSQIRAWLAQPPSEQRDSRLQEVMPARVLEAIRHWGLYRGA
ncbi:MAG TPA: nicotinate-nicotinamide nucleotide adenylyltransferase [Polyangiaceae bacterium]|nr:nicotinate-nicotinamide nucleotide adenylyltransferase [Polyangiaceae bacterium]